MTVATLVVHIPMQGITSLKDKRKIIKSLIERIQSRFNASISEIAAQDNHRFAVIGIAIVSNSSTFLQQQIDTILNFIRQDNRIVTARIDREIFHVDVELPLL